MIIDEFQRMFQDQSVKVEKLFDDLNREVEHLEFILLATQVFMTLT